MPIFRSVSKKEHEKLKKWYSEQLRIKDKEIAELKEINLALIKAAIKQSNKLEDMKLRFERAVRKIAKK